MYSVQIEFCASDLVPVEVELAKVRVSDVIATCIIVEFKFSTVINVGTGKLTDAFAGIVKVKLEPLKGIDVLASVSTN